MKQKLFFTNFIRSFIAITVLLVIFAGSQMVIIAPAKAQSTKAPAAAAPVVAAPVAGAPAAGAGAPAAGGTNIYTQSPGATTNQKNHTTSVNTDLGPFSNFGDFVTAVYAWALPVVGAIALIIVIYAGFLYMTSQGDTNQIGTAKELLMGVVLGLLLLLTADIFLHNIIGTKVW